MVWTPGGSAISGRTAAIARAPVGGYVSRKMSPRTIVSKARVALDDDPRRALHPVPLRLEIEPSAPQRDQPAAAADVGRHLAVVAADRPGLDDVAGPLAPHLGQDGHALEDRLVDARARPIRPSSISASTRKLRIMNPAPGGFERSADALVAQDAVAPERRVGDALQPDLVEGQDVRERGERQGDRQVVPEPGARGSDGRRPATPRRGRRRPRPRGSSAGGRARRS